MFLIFFRNILIPQQMFPRLLAEEAMLTGFCGHVGCISYIKSAQTSVKCFLGYPARKQS